MVYKCVLPGLEGGTLVYISDNQLFMKNGVWLLCSFDVLSVFCNGLKVRDIAHDRQAQNDRL